ncbi:hypothetical protein [Sporosarcina sp. SAFN-010]|uniref:hypothetical protein n=1 Tax=Sporosarcina sp. SAFN-010 TaxID=3387273 RepID=UPI003F7E96BB
MERDSGWFGELPARLGVRPDQFAEQPARFSMRPDQFDGKPARFREQPDRFGDQPARFSMRPDQFPEQPARFHEQPDQFINQPAQFNTHQPPSNFLHPQPTPFITESEVLNPSNGLLHMTQIDAYRTIFQKIVLNRQNLVVKPF